MYYYSEVIHTIEITIHSSLQDGNLIAVIASFILGDLAKTPKCTTIVSTKQALVALPFKITSK